MAEALDKKVILLENLQDAGCDSKLIDDCITLADKLKTTEVIQLLRIYRTSLLNKVHKSQDELDCLDFLIYKLQKQKKL